MIGVTRLDNALGRLCARLHGIDFGVGPTARRVRRIVFERADATVVRVGPTLGDWPSGPRRAARLCTAAGPVQWPVFVRRAEYSRRRLSILNPGASDRRNGERFGEGRVWSAEIEYSRSRFLVCIVRYSRAEYARRRSSTLDPGILGDGSEGSEAEYARRRSSTLDPGILGDGSDLESRVRSTETEYARSQDLSDSVRVSRIWVARTGSV